MNVEDIMRQVRTRVADRRGDPTEQDVHRLASAKLDALLASHKPGTDGIQLLFGSQNGFVRFLRRILKPILALFINTDALAASATRGETFGQLVRQLVTENARLQLEVNRLKMRVESLSTRFEFEERRAKVMGPRQPRPAQPQAEAAQAGPARGDEQEESAGEGNVQRMRRRRRRRGRRGPGVQQAGAHAGHAEGAGGDEQAPAPGDNHPRSDNQPSAERQGAETPSAPARNDVEP